MKGIYSLREGNEIYGVGTKQIYGSGLGKVLLFLAKFGLMYTNRTQTSSLAR
jgi:hypothetical protein